MQPKKQKSDTLRQRDKAMKEFLELKKMQSGELKPEPKPSDIAIKPQTFKEKKENFLYHYKTTAIIVAISIVVAIGLIYSWITSTEYDGAVGVYCYQEISQTSSDKIVEYIRDYYPDLTDNGKVEITVANCSYDPDSTDIDKIYAYEQNLQLNLSAKKDTLLYILSKETLDYLNALSDDVVLFKEENCFELSNDFYSFTGISPTTEQKDRLYLCLRTIKETETEPDGTIAKNYETVKKALEEIRIVNK